MNMKMLKNIALGLLVAFTASTISYAAPQTRRRSAQTRKSRPARAQRGSARSQAQPQRTVEECQSEGGLFGKARVLVGKAGVNVKNKLAGLLGAAAPTLGAAAPAAVQGTRWLGLTCKRVTMWTLKYYFLGECYTLKHAIKSILELAKSTLDLARGQRARCKNRLTHKFAHELAWTVISYASAVLATQLAIHIFENVPELANEFASTLANLLEWALPTAAISNRTGFLSGAISVIVNLTSRGYSELIRPALKTRLNYLKNIYEYAYSIAAPAGVIVPAETSVAEIL